MQVARRLAGMLISSEDLPVGSFMQESSCNNFLTTSFFNCTMIFCQKNTTLDKHRDKAFCV